MWYVWLQSVTGDWTVTMRQSSLALYWFRFLNFCLIKQNFVWCGVPQQMWASQPDQLFHLWWLPNCPPIFNLLGQRKNSHTVSYKDANFYCILRKSGGGGGRYLKIDKYCYFMHSGWACKALVSTLIPGSQKLIQSLLLETLAGWCGRQLLNITVFSSQG